MPELDGSFEEDITIIREFIRDKVEKTGSNGLVLGLSGGLDSATVLKLCADSIGEKNILCLIMPEKESPREDIDDAEWFAQEMGVEWKKIPIDDILESFPTDQESRLPYANLKARVRMCIWYYHANAEKKLVVGGGNKSELLLGYNTKYGDSAVDLLPLGDVYKTDVRKMAEIIDVPKRFIDKEPRAGLWEGQTDEDELGYPYDIIDKILKGLEGSRSVGEIHEYTEIEREAIQEIKDMVEKSAHKRKLPTIVKLRNRTVGFDWREYSD